MIGQGQPPLFTIPPTAPREPAGPAWPLWTVYVIGLLTGAILLVSRMAPSIREAPILTAAAVVAFGLFAGLCSWLLSRINVFRKATPRTAVLAFLWGGFAAAGYGLVANSAVHAHWTARGRNDWSLWAPLIEEPAKNVGVVLVLLLAGTRPRTALDGLVAGSFVGLGFEVAESIARALTNAITYFPPGERDNLGSLATDVIHEVLRNSWTGHIVLTGIAGFGIGYLLTACDRSQIRRWGVAIALIALATAGHLLWNSHRFGLFYVVGQFGLLAFFLWLIQIGRNHEAEVYTPYLRYAPSLVKPSQWVEMRTGAGRRGRETRADQRALADLAAAIANGDAQRAHKSAAALDGVRAR